MFPNEIYMYILKYVPYEILYGSVRFVNHQLSHIASELIEKYYFVPIIFLITYKHGKHVAIWHSCYTHPQQLSYRPLPKCDPPSFIKIRRLHIEGQITEKLIIFLHRIKRVVSACKIDFENLEKFTLKLTRSEICLNNFFDALPSRCFKIWIDRINCLNAKNFLFSRYVLNCNSLYIHKFINGSKKSILNWLFIVIETKVRRKPFIMNSDSSSVNKLFNCINKEAIKNQNFDANFDIFFNSIIPLREDDFVVKDKLRFHHYNESSGVFYTVNGHNEQIPNENLSDNNENNITIIDIKIGK